MKLTLIFVLASIVLVSSYTIKSLTIKKTIVDIEEDSLQKFLSILTDNKISKKLSFDQETQIVNDYVTKFNKNLGRSKNENDKRRKIILNNFYKVREHNEKLSSGETTFEMQLNHFSDFTDEELRQMNGLNINYDEYEEENNVTLPQLPDDRKYVVGTPLSHNWADHGIVQPVQNQGSCGSCYAFAALGAIEGSMCRFKKQCIKLSEQEAMECTRGCEGGDYSMVYRYTQRNGGCAFDKNYPYAAFHKSYCRNNGPRVPNSRVKNFINFSRDPEKIKSVVYNYGPVYVGFEIFNDIYYYKDGIYSTCNSRVEGYHAVLIVGFGEENGRKFWIAKNSWGKEWGNEGYFKISRGNNCAKFESLSLSFPIVE